MMIDGGIPFPLPRSLWNPAAVLIAAGLGLGGCATTLSKFEPAREVVCSESAKISLKEAVEAAEKQGGRAIDAHYHQADELGCLMNKPGYYDVTLLFEGRRISTAVDAHSGKVAPQPDQGTMWDRTGQFFEKTLTSDPEEDARIAPAAALTLPDAIALAGNSGSRVLKAYVDRKSGKPGYTVKLVEHGKVRVVWVDGNSDATFLARSKQLDPGFRTRGLVGIGIGSFQNGADDEELGPNYDEEIETEG